MAEGYRQGHPGREAVETLRLATLVKRGLLGPLLLGVAIRMLVAPLSGHPWDTYVWYHTTEALVQGYSMYGLQGGYAYPPLWGGFLGLVGLVYGPLSALLSVHPISEPTAWALLGTTHSLGTEVVADWLFVLLVKMPIILFDCLTAFLLYRIVDVRFHNPRAARTAFILFFLNPFVIWISSVWGMFDILPTYFAMLGMLLFLDHRGWASGWLFGIAAGLKYFPALLLFALILAYRHDMDRRFLREVSASFLIVLVLVSVPFLFLDGGAYVTGILSPASGVYVGNMTIWDVASDLGLSIIPGWISVLNLAAVVLVAAIVGWSLGKSREGRTEPMLWSDVSILTLLVFYLLFRTVNEQYIVWIIPFLTLDVVLRQGRLRTLVWMSGVPLLHSIFALRGSSFFLPTLTLAPQWAHFVPMSPDWPPVPSLISVVFWVGLLFLFRSRLRRWGGFRSAVALFSADSIRLLTHALRNA